MDGMGFDPFFALWIFPFFFFSFSCWLLWNMESCYAARSMYYVHRLEPRHAQARKGGIAVCTTTTRTE